MRTMLMIAAVSMGLAGCATSWFERGNTGSTAVVRSLHVTQESHARSVLEEVPLESAMERFELLDTQNRLISYVAFTDTAHGGIVFVDNRLHGIVSRRDAQAFYSCRGYITALHRHWAQDAEAWGDSLLAASAPASSVRLDFSGKSTTQSLQEVVKNNPFVDQVRLLVSMGSNPLGIFRTLDRMRDNMIARERYENTLVGLSAISPGMGERQVADVIMPEEVSFTRDGVVMAYPSHLVEYFVKDGHVQVIQQPSFNYLARMQITLFYAPNAQWNLCTPLGWRTAFSDMPLPEDKLDAKRKRSLQAAEHSFRTRGNPAGGLWNLGAGSAPSGGSYGATVRRGGEE